MRRALVWLNLYGLDAVLHKLKNSLKTQKMHFLPVLEQSWENEVFFESAILIFFFKKNFFLLHLDENKQAVHMRYHLFLQYGWFLQNLGKDFIQTNMHTTVAIWKAIFSNYAPLPLSNYVMRLYMFRATNSCISSGINLY